MAEIDGDVARLRAHRVGVHEQRRERSHGERECRRNHTRSTRRLPPGTTPSTSDGQDQPGERGEHEQPDVHVDRPTDQTQRLLPRGPVQSPRPVPPLRR